MFMFLIITSPPYHPLKKVEDRFRFPQRFLVPVPTKTATSMAQSVFGNGPTGVIQRDDTIEIVDPRLVKLSQIFFDPHELLSAWLTSRSHRSFISYWTSSHI